MIVDPAITGEGIFMKAVRRIAAGIAVLAVSATLSISGAGMAAAAPSSQDTDYITTNGQTNLAEITIGQLALERAQNDATRALAQMTLTDHQAALAKLQAVAAQLGVAVPTEPSPEQKQNAATLQAVDDAAFDLTYDQIQVAGHQKSIAGTNQEIAAGSDPSVVGYAQGYLPVATMHLQMAQDALAEVGGTPAAVPAGTGGMAATTTSSTVGLQGILGLIGLLAIVAGMLILRRRSSSH
jgi:putative membrane protein